MRVVNLSRRPFVNTRPVVRLAVLLWVVGLLFSILNLRLYWDYWTGSSTARERLGAVGQEISAAGKEIEGLNQQVREVRVMAVNQRTVFLNQLILRRAFPWSALFDQLGEVLPDEVWLRSVQPSVELVEEMPEVVQGNSRRVARNAAATSRRRQAPTNNQVRLGLKGLAVDDLEVFELLDRLYENPAFGRPVLESTQRDTRRGGIVSFSLHVPYLLPGELLAESPPDPGNGDAGPDEPSSGEPSPDGTETAATEAGQPVAADEDEKDAEGPDQRPRRGADQAGRANRPPPVAADRSAPPPGERRAAPGRDRDRFRPPPPDTAQPGDRDPRGARSNPSGMTTRFPPPSLPGRSPGDPRPPAVGTDATAGPQERPRAGRPPRSRPAPPEPDLIEGEGLGDEEEPSRLVPAASASPRARRRGGMAAVDLRVPDPLREALA